MATARSPSRSTSDIIDTTPFLGGGGSSSPSSSSSSSSDDSGNSSSRRFVQRQSLRQAARFLRQASSRRVLREPSMMVREAAAEQLEERQSDWAYSKPVVVLDVLWNFAFVVAAAAVLVLSRGESPDVPLRLWIVGYAMQCALHVVCVCVEYRRRRRRGMGGVQSSAAAASAEEEEEEEGMSLGSASGPHIVDDNNSVAKHLESANTMFSFIWWIIGFYWVSTGGQTLVQSSPQLYWLCVVFLGFDVFFVVFCVALACIIGIAVCCCLPCIIALLYAVADQEGATKEDIEQLSKFKFVRSGNNEKLSSDAQGLLGGTMTECGTDSPAEYRLSHEDAECCICLSGYEDGVELRQLPCGHHFHCPCVDKWLFINATCPLCKYNILKSSCEV